MSRRITYADRRDKAIEIIDAAGPKGAWLSNESTHAHGGLVNASTARKLAEEPEYEIVEVGRRSPQFRIRRVSSK